MFLGEEKHLVIEEAPVAGAFADGNDGNQEARCSGEIRSLYDTAWSGCFLMMRDW